MRAAEDFKRIDNEIFFDRYTISKAVACILKCTSGNQYDVNDIRTPISPWGVNKATWRLVFRHKTSVIRKT